MVNINMLQGRKLYNPSPKTISKYFFIRQRFFFTSCVIIELFSFCNKSKKKYQPIFTNLGSFERENEMLEDSLITCLNFGGEVHIKWAGAFSHAHSHQFLFTNFLVRVGLLWL